MALPEGALDAVTAQVGASSKASTTAQDCGSASRVPASTAA